MIASPHLAAGMALGLWSSRRFGPGSKGILAATLLGLVSHVVLDAIPHWEYPESTYTRPGIMDVRVIVIGEALGLLAFLYWRLGRPFTGKSLLPLAVGAFCAAIPDIKFIQVFGFRGPFWDALSSLGMELHQHFHARHPTDPFWGLVPQIAVLFLCLWYLARSRHSS